MTLNETLAAGRLHWPGEDGYEERRLPWQRRFDSQPAAIVDAREPRDVRAALEIMRDNDLPLVVQATGHGAVEASDGALLLTTAGMRGVEVASHHAGKEVYADKVLVVDWQLGPATLRSGFALDERTAPAWAARLRPLVPR